MGYYTKDLPVLNFATSNSNIISGVDDLEGLSVFATTSSGIFTVQVAPTSAGPFTDLQSAGADVTMTAPATLTISPVAFRHFQLASTFGSTGSTGAVTGAGGTGFPVQAVFVV